MMAEIISIIALVFSGIATVVALLQARRHATIERMPILVIAYDGVTKRWRISNLGKGPALNIVVAQQGEGGKHDWYNPVAIPAIEGSGNFVLEWLKEQGSFSLGASYSDFLEEGDDQSRHFTYTSDDRCRVYLPGQHPDYAMPAFVPSQVQRHWWASLSWQRPGR